MLLSEYWKRKKLHDFIFLILLVVRIRINSTGMILSMLILNILYFFLQFILLKLVSKEEDRLYSNFKKNLLE